MTFDATAAWTADIESEDEWAKIKTMSGNDKAGRGGIKIQFEKNPVMANRTANLYITVEGYPRAQMAVFEQSSAIVSNTADSGNGLPAFKFGYMVTESFDLSAQVVIEDQIKQFVDENITDMILDLRYNVGGSVPQSRYISSAIVGPCHDDDIFFKAEYVDGRIENWTFGYGYTQTPDGLTHAPDLGLNRLFVIVSESTASPVRNCHRQNPPLTISN